MLLLCKEFLKVSTIPIPEWYLPLDEKNISKPPPEEKEDIKTFFTDPQSVWVRNLPIIIKNIPKDLDLEIAATAIRDEVRFIYLF